MSYRSLGLIIFALFYCTKCQDTTSDICDLPKDEGDGTNVIVYMYYDKTADKCYPFRYFGTGGNGNRFIAEMYCMRNCSANAAQFYPTNATDVCHLPKATGDCLGTYLRYYYDVAHGKCKGFFWTGCVGNGNRFMGLEQCNKTCFGIGEKQEESEEQDQDAETNAPVGIILGVLLGVIGAIILIIVLVLVLKKKSSKSKTSKSKPKDAPGSEIPLQANQIQTA